MLKREKFCYIGERSPVTDKIRIKVVRDMRCKHVCRLNSNKAKDLLAASEQIGYRHCMWGYGEGYGNNPELNRAVQLSRIQRFIYDQTIRPVRIVEDEKGILWADNLHSIISHVIARGNDCILGEIPYYLIRQNHSTEMTEIHDPHKLFDLSRYYGALTSADMRLSRINDDIRDVRYTIGEFMDENELHRECMTLNIEAYGFFCDETDKLMS